MCMLCGRRSRTVPISTSRAKLVFTDRTHLAAIFIPKFTWLPAEVVPTIVAFWADCGGHLPRALNPHLPPNVHSTGHTSES